MTENNYQPESFSSQWIIQGITPDVVEWAKAFAQHLCTESGEKKQLTTGQLRKFFGEVKKIKYKKEIILSDIVMLKPFLAYAVGRDKKKGGENKTKIEDFGAEMTTALNTVCVNGLSSEQLSNRFNNFCNILESIVAYHKFYTRE